MHNNQQWPSQLIERQVEDALVEHAIDVEIKWEHEREAPHHRTMRKTSFPRAFHRAAENVQCVNRGGHKQDVLQAVQVQPVKRAILEHVRSETPE